MINYGKRQFIRYVMMGLAFALVSFLLNSCKVNAQVYDIITSNYKKQNLYRDSALIISNQEFNTNQVWLGGNAYSKMSETGTSAGATFSTLIWFNITDKNMLKENNTLQTINGMAGGFVTQTYFYIYEIDSNGDLQLQQSQIQCITTTQVQASETINVTYTGNLCTYDNNEIDTSKNYRALIQTYYTNYEFYNYPSGTQQRVPITHVFYQRRVVDFIKSSEKTMQDNIQDTTNKVNEIKDAITDDSDQDVSSMSGATGWLPQGTIDGLINLPISLIQGVTNGLNQSCTTLNLPLPFVNKTLPLPCVKDIFDNITGLNALLTLICTPIMIFILYNYFKNLFQWMQSQIAMEGNSNWGGV